MEDLAQYERELCFTTSEDIAYRAPLLQALEASTFETNDAAFQLMSQLGKTAHIGMRYCYDKYVPTISSFKTDAIINGTVRLSEIQGNVAKLISENTCELANDIKRASASISSSERLSRQVVGNLVFSVERYCKQHGQAASDFTNFWDALFAGCTTQKTTEKLLPATFIGLVRKVIQGVDLAFGNHKNIPDRIAALAFFIPYVKKSEDLDKLTRSINIPSDDHHAILLEAEFLLETALKVESDFFRVNSNYCDYTSVSQESVYSSFLATRIALAAIWLEKCPGPLTSRLITIFFKPDEVATSILDKLFFLDLDESPQPEVSQDIFKALVDQNGKKLNIDILTEYSNADYVYESGSHVGRLGKTCRGIFCNGYIDFLSEVYCNLLKDDQFSNTVKVAVASKLALFERFPKSTRVYEPPSLTPNPIANGGSMHDACRLPVNVFQPLNAELAKSQGATSNSQILNIVNKIYFSDNESKIPQLGFDWIKQKNGWEFIKSDSHIPARLRGDSWGGPYFWLFGKCYADAVERAISSALALTPTDRADSPHWGRTVACVHEELGSNPQHPAQLTEHYLNQQTFSSQAARLARFILMVPRPKVKHFNPASKIYELADYPLVRDDMKSCVLALARRVSRKIQDYELRFLYQPIYDSSHMVGSENPFFGQVESTK